LEIVATRFLSQMTNPPSEPPPPLIAADIGNARIKLGLFAGGCSTGLPEPVRTLPLLGNAPELDQIANWLGDDAGEALGWWIASVNRPTATRLLDWLHEHRPQDRITLLAAGDLPLVVRLPRPDMVGVDRLVDAVAVNRLRDADRPAVIVDVGSAITVDLVSADGAFLGGAILPGIAMSARAMHEFTDLLPLVDVAELDEPPPALGTATVPAMQSGLFWGTVGAIRQIIEELKKAATGGRAENGGGSATATPTSYSALSIQYSGSTATPTARRPQVFLTGGAGATVAELLGPDARYVPHLTLAGIALASIVSSSGTDRRLGGRG
jgi:type III pantothenate kinase